MSDGFMHFHDLPFEQLERFPNAIEDMHCGRFEGLIIRGVYSRDAAEALARQIESGASPIERMPWPTQESEPAASIYGRPLMIESNESRYFASAARFREGCRTLFTGLPDFEERMVSVFERLSGGRRVRVPTTSAGESYTPATIRVLPPTRDIGLHVGNDFIRYPQARQLAAYADISCQLSYFVTLRGADAGGELLVYSVQWSDVENARLQRSGASPGYGDLALARSLLPDSQKVSFKPESGDLLMFDGGRYYHCITPVEGTRNRVTIGGFLVFSADHRAIYYWS